MFIRMHGLGNNFVIVDSRLLQHSYSNIADCKGYDQIIILTHSSAADCLMHIYNVDGSRAEICGNAARCVGYLIMLEKGNGYTTIELINGRILECFKVGDKLIMVNMGKPSFQWHEIPLSIECDTLYLPIEFHELKNPSAVNISNPHMVFFVENIDIVPLHSLAPQLENHPLFPNRANVSIAQIEKSGEINLRVWERGTGITAACGSAACAALVTSILRGYVVNKQTFINLPGGQLLVEWKDDIFITGDVDFLE
jgi:diaminopimelate epimerase